ncbi:hypothetical protein PCANC_08429 [Puccinia coronata f. sp. avenae]|uniref:Uncharacterized protein n=1 Tax=Puccinia coronata f. sp. avenae TaxID=200324 RepID=A0A2N5VPR6_9BASI|nr:hypothetical protein PCANC_08429 [Puccinia coronata f. sp. avenae]
MIRIEGCLQPPPVGGPETSPRVDVVESARYLPSGRLYRRRGTYMALKDVCSPREWQALKRRPFSTIGGASRHPYRRRGICQRGHPGVLTERSTMASAVIASSCSHSLMTTEWLDGRSHSPPLVPLSTSVAEPTLQERPTCSSESLRRKIGEWGSNFKTRLFLAFIPFHFDLLLDPIPHRTIILNKMIPATSSSQSRSSLKYPALSHQSTRNLPLPGQHKPPQSFHRVQFEDYRSSPQFAGVQNWRLNVVQTGPSRIPCRVQSVGSQHGITSRVRKGQGELSSLAHQVWRNRKCKLAEAQGIERPRISSSPPTQPANRRQQNPKIYELISTHSRTPLSPCLSSPSKIHCLISTLNPGGCEKLLQTIHRPVATKNETHVNGNSLKIKKKAYTLSPSWCSPNIHTTAYKHIIPRGQTQRVNNEILSVFLKNNGGYLDDSDDEDEEEGEDDGADGAFNSLRFTVALLKRIPHPFESRTPSLIPSFQILSANESIPTSPETPNNFSCNSSRQPYWKRIKPDAPVTSSRTGSQFTFYNK